MKVLFFDYSPFFGGAERSLMSLMPRLDAGIEPVLVAGRSAQWPREASEKGIKCHAMDIGPRLSAISQRQAVGGGLHPGLWAEYARARRAFDRICIQERPDAICANTFKAAIFTGMHQGICGAKLIWYVRDIVGGAAGGLWWLLGSVKRPHLIAVSRAAASQPALHWAGSDPKVVYNGIDCAAWRHKSEENTVVEIRSKLGLDPGEKMLASFGQLAPWKGQENALTALAWLHKRGVMCKLALVGDAVFSDHSYPRKLKALAERMGISNRVKFCGWVNNPAPYMAAADIVVHTPFKPEPFGRVVVEAMCLGKAVVAFRSGAIPELIEDGTSGMLCGREDLPLVLEKLIYDPARARAIGLAACKRADLKFNLQATAAGASEVFMDIISRNRAGER